MMWEGSVNNNNNNNNNNSNVPGYFAILENGFGLVGTAFWSFQLVPQAYKNWHGKSTRGLSAAMMLIWALSGFSSGIYAIIIKLSIPLTIQPQLFGIICLFCFAQCLYYDRPRFVGRRVESGSAFLAITIASIGVQTASVYGIRAANDRNIAWPETVSGVIPVILIIMGFIPQYYEIYCEKSVRGISLVFMAIDILGSVFSTISLAFRPPPFDTLASLTYASVFTLDSIIVILHYLLNWLHAKRVLKTTRSDETPQLDKESVALVNLEDKDGRTLNRIGDEEADTFGNGESGRTEGCDTRGVDGENEKTQVIAGKDATRGDEENEKIQVITGEKFNEE